jgi:uncharacterized repeat protein (TIGR04052 family)
MRPYPGDLFEHLRAFHALAAEIERDTDRAFERTARGLRLDPSVLRRRMRTLGAWSGAPLWSGRGPGLRLTGAGRHLRAEAAALLGRVEALGRGARPEPERLAVGGTGAFIAGPLPEIAESLFASHPRLRLAVRRVGSEACRAGLREGQLDLGVMRGVARPRDVRSERLCADRVWLALPSGHPLAGASTLRRSAIAAQPIISFGPSSQTRSRTLSALEPLGAKVRIEVDGKAAALECVRRGLGVGLLSLLPNRPIEAPGVALRDVTSLFPSSWFWAAWPPGRPPAGPALHVLERLREVTAGPPRGSRNRCDNLPHPRDAFVAATVRGMGRIIDGLLRPARTVGLAPGALALALPLLGGCGGESDEAVAPRSVSIEFSPRVAGQPFACSSTYAGLGTKGTTVRPADFRLYVHDVALVTRAGAEVPVALEEDGVWQHEGLAMLDFEDGSGSCATGSPETNLTVRGTVPGGDYVGLRFRLGVPEAMNHLDAATALAPLNVPGLWWSWKGGYKFVKLDLETEAGEPYYFHMGATTCEGTPGEGFSCAYGNVAAIDLDGFSPDASRVVIDIADFYADSDLSVQPDMKTDFVPGCMAFAGDPECPAVFDKLGLSFESLAPGPRPQSLFRLE